MLTNRIDNGSLFIFRGTYWRMNPYSISDRQRFIDNVIDEFHRISCDEFLYCHFFLIYKQYPVILSLQHNNYVTFQI